MADMNMFSLVSPPKTPAKYFHDLGIEVITFVKERDVSIEWGDFDDSIVLPTGEFLTEEHMNSEMALVFSTIFSNATEARVVVNSEFYPWLPYNLASVGAAGKDKPDFWLGYCAIVIRKSPPRNAFASEEILYGIPCDRCIQYIDGLILMEGKTGHISNTELGKLCQYLAKMQSSGNPHPKGIVYNLDEFVYIEFDQILPTRSAIRCRWDSPGSRAFLSSKFCDSNSSTIMRVLRGVQKSICPVVSGASISPTSSILGATSLMEGSVASATTRLCATPRNATRIFEESFHQTAVFLGRGRYGHVFQLTSNSDVTALKISDDPVSLEA
jgi:hypothetical protein